MNNATDQISMNFKIAAMAFAADIVDEIPMIDTAGNLTKAFRFDRRCLLRKDFVDAYWAIKDAEDEK